ncbi:MAG: ABC transporter ATP-binding protein [Desulfurococcaceae archaeon]
MSDLMLRCDGLTSGYGDTQVLWDVSFFVRRGEVLSVLGPNGAGKTTLLRTLVGLLRAWKGAIFFEGRDVTRLPPHERVRQGLSLVPEGRALFGDMTVYENILMGAHALPKGERKRLGDTLELIFTLFPVLKERLGQRARTLSGGEQQMLAIARALVARPRLLLLDEPTQGLSPKLSAEVVRAVARLRDEAGITVLLVEEKIRQALEISDRAYVMNEGRLVKEIPRERFSAEERFLRDFLGV